VIPNSDIVVKFGWVMEDALIAERNQVTANANTYVTTNTTTYSFNLGSRGDFMSF